MILNKMETQPPRVFFLFTFDILNTLFFSRLIYMLIVKEID